MKLTRYIMPLLKWWWLIILSSLMAAIPAYLITRPQPPVYMARTTLVVGRAISDPNPSGNEFALTQQLAQAYAGIVSREPVREATMNALGLDKLPTYSAHTVPNSPFIEIMVTDINPARAQIVANELANQVIAQSPTAPQRQEQERSLFVNQQLDSLQGDIVKTQDNITEKQHELANTTSAIEISQISDEIQGLETKLSLLQTNFAALMSSTQTGALNTLSVLEMATLPTIPIGPHKTLIILLATAGGFIFAVGAVYLIEFLDRSLKTAEQINNQVKLPVIGHVGNAGRNGWRHVIDSPRSPIAEAFRSLRINLEYYGVDEPLKMILFTSPDIGDGKTLIAANLALTISQTEKRVIFLDCDLRRPNVYRAMGIQAGPGLSEVLREHLSIMDAVQYTNGKNLAIIPAGSIPPNPTELLSSRRMKQVLGTLSEMFDVIVIDCAPLMITDALVLSTQVDGVVLVTRYAHTTESALTSVVEQLKRVNARVVGVVLNRIPRSNAMAYRYYASRYYDHEKENPSAAQVPANLYPRKRKFLQNGIKSIRTIFHKTKQDAIFDSGSDEYLFSRISSGSELENITPPSEKK